MTTILIVDDQDAVRMVLRDALEQEGSHVQEARNGAEAILMYRENPADVIVTDIIMPDKEGIETIIELRELAPDVKIIAISGGGRIRANDFLDMAKKLGAAHVLRKPFRMKELVDLVKSCLANGRHG